MGTDTPRNIRRETLTAACPASPARYRRRTRVRSFAGPLALAVWLALRGRDQVAAGTPATLDEVAYLVGLELLRHLTTHLCRWLLPELVDAHSVRHALNPEPRRHLYRSRSVSCATCCYAAACMARTRRRSPGSRTVRGDRLAPDGRPRAAAERAPESPGHRRTPTTCGRRHLGGLCQTIRRALWRIPRLPLEGRRSDDTRCTGAVSTSKPSTGSSVRPPTM
jgi:hypothetical protein